MPEINLATLEKQNEILSNFPIKVIDWEEKTSLIICATGSHEANTYLNITGSGYLTGIVCGSATICIQIDGGDIYKREPGNNPGRSIPLFPIRFKTSLVVSGSSGLSTTNAQFIGVVLD